MSVGWVPLGGTATGAGGAALALESGGNLAASKTDLDTLIAAIIAGKMQVQQSGALPAGTNVLGHVVVDSAGNVAITSALPAGANLIGHVVVDSGASLNVTALPALPTGSNTIGAVTAPGGGALGTQATLAAIQALLPTALGAHGGLVIEGVASGVAVPVSAASLPLPANAAQETSGNLATIATAVGAGSKTAAASLSIVGPTNKPLMVADATPTGQLWTGLDALEVDSATATGILAIPAATGQRLRQLVILNYGSGAASIVVFVYHGAAPSFGAITGLIGFTSVGANTSSNTNVLGWPGGIDVHDGATVVVSTVSTSLTRPTNAIYAVGLFGI